VAVVLHVPHASTYLPDDVRQGIALDDDALAREMLASTDHHTDRLVAGLDELNGIATVQGARVALHVNTLSRLVVDPERFLDPEREDTETVGRGAVYTRGFDGAVLRDTDDPGWAALREGLIMRHFLPYHAAIEQLVAGMLARHGICTIIDVHSYPRDAQPYELAPEGARPEVCIGTDDAHTPGTLVAIVRSAAETVGFACARDTPFSGTFVPTPWLGDPRVSSVMLEIRRDTYMDESTGEPHVGLERVRELVRRVTEGVLADVAR
jgi:N-formylglutamate deformylase